LARVAPVSGFGVFAGPRMLELLRPGTPLRLVQLESCRAYAAVYAHNEQVGTLALDSLGVMSCCIPPRATIHNLERDASGKHQLWIECRW
jgi:hypothetical protein